MLDALRQRIVDLVQIKEALEEELKAKPDCKNCKYFKPKNKTKNGEQE